MRLSERFGKAPNILVYRRGWESNNSCDWALVVGSSKTVATGGKLLVNPCKHLFFYLFFYLWFSHQV